MKRPLLLAAVSLALVAGAAALGLLLRAGDAPAAYRGSQPPAGIELPSFSLRDHDGAVVSSESLRGKAVALTFLETKCTDACPVVGEHVREALARLGAEERADVVAVAISVHPGDDTPESVRAFLRRHRVEGALRYLIGTEAELRPLWKALGVLSAVDTGNPNLHSVPVRVYDRDGEWASTLHVGVDLTPEALAHDLAAALGG